MALIQGNVPGIGTIEISQLALTITLGQHVLQCRTQTSTPDHWVNANQRQKPMRFDWLKRGHLRDKIEYLCESRRGHALPEKVGDSLLVGVDTRRKPHCIPFVALHGQNASAVKTGPSVEPHKSLEMPQVPAWLREHPSRRGIVAKGKGHERYDLIFLRSGDSRNARNGRRL